MRTTIRSKILIALGTMIYGTPDSFGVKCSATEFYCTVSDRVEADPKKFHTMNISNWKNMRANKTIDDARLRAFKHVCLFSFAISLSVFIAGSTLTASIVKGKELVSTASARLDSNKEKEARLIYLKQEAKNLTALAQSGKISEDDYKTQSKAIQDQYNAVKEGL